MFDGLGKVGALLAGAVVLGAMVSPVMAADFHGQNGHVFYRGMHSAPYHGMHGGAVGNRVVDGRNFDFRGRFSHQGLGRSRFEHRGFGNDGGNRGMTAQNDMPRHRPDGSFGHGGDARRFDANHLPILASRDFSTRRGGGISVINRSQPDYDFISNDGGSVDVYHADGGTYITGYGDGGRQQDDSVTIRPREKIIDVARMRNSCAYENGVCVIRP
jgi:hypothetical protein